MENLFKVGDLVQMDNQFDLNSHPPMGTYGIITYVEDWDSPTIDELQIGGVMVDVDQFVRVYWAHHKNHDDQCYTDASLKKVSEA